MAETACNRSILTENDRIEILKEFKAPAIKLGTKAAALPDAGKIIWERGDEMIVDNGSATALFRYNASRDVFITESDDFRIAEHYKAIFPASAYAPESVPGAPLPQLEKSLKIHPGYIKNLPMEGTAGKDAVFTFTASYAPLCIDFPMDRLPGDSGGFIKLIHFNTPDTSLSYECAQGTNASQTLYLAVPAGHYLEGFSIELLLDNSSTFTLECKKNVVLSPDVFNFEELVRDVELFSGGDGSAENPYILNSVGDFMEFIERCSNDPEMLKKHYRQECNIRLEGSWAFKPIGSSESPFKGQYNGTGHSISGAVWNTETGGEATGLFRYTDGAAICGLKLEAWTLQSRAQYLGSFVGYAKNTTFTNCSFGGTLKQDAKAPMENFEHVTVNDNKDFGFCGGLAGYAEGCTFEGCACSGTLSATGKALGGITGYARGCTVKNCTVSKEAGICSLNSCAGGITGAMTEATSGNGASLIEGCSVSCSISALSNCGGIAGYVQKGDIRNCVVGGSSLIGGSQNNIGGIAGSIIPKASQTCSIDRCTAYCDVSGQHSAGGIAGFIDGNNISGKIYVTNCSYIGGTVTTTGTDSNQYALAGGICGWIQKSWKTVIENCLSAPSMIRTSMQNAPETSLKECKGGTGGLVGANTNDVGENIISNCFTNVSIGSFRHCSKIPTAFDSYTLWGAIMGKCIKLDDFGKNYYCSDDALLKAVPDGQAGKSCSQGLDLKSISNGTVTTLLNTAQYSGSAEMSKWLNQEGNYPLLECTIKDPAPRSASGKRVSIIGDSISSFSGYIPSGYSFHYPCSDGSVTRVEQTWWHQLIYKKLSDARLEMNISYAGSAVANSDEAASGKRTDHWCNNSYVQRYIRLGGIGQPDIVFIHGGTNDWAHSDFCPLYPGSADCRNAEAPPAGILKTIFDTADAADNREEIESLAHNDFCSAYIKLLCLIRNQYPDAKIVCIIGDYLSEGIEKSIIAIADHYGAKYIDLLAVNGFNDQVYMPKHDYNGSTGCHPNAKAMTFIADKIYGELGVWMEE